MSRRETGLRKATAKATVPTCVPTCVPTGDSRSKGEKISNPCEQAGPLQRDDRQIYAGFDNLQKLSLKAHFDLIESNSAT